MFRKAYKLNPKEKYLNFYIAEMLQRKDSVLESEPYLMAEKKISDYVQCDFYLARVYMVKGEKQQAINSLARYLERDKSNSMAHNNLLLLYIETGQTDKARAHLTEMRHNGLNVPAGLAAQLGM
jgi:tetratricopeptide (TPR) repeat protein